MKFVYSMKEWRSFVKSAVRSVLVGVFRLVWSVVIAATNVIHYAYVSVRDFTCREFRASLVIGLIGLMGLMGWIVTFVNERAQRVHAEMQRDSLCWELDRISAGRDGIATYGTMEHWKTTPLGANDKD